MTFLEARELIYNRELLIRNSNLNQTGFITQLIWPNAKYIYSYNKDRLIIQDENDSNEWKQIDFGSTIPHINTSELVNLFYEIEIGIDDIQTLEF